MANHGESPYYNIILDKDISQQKNTKINVMCFFLAKKHIEAIGRNGVCLVAVEVCKVAKNIVTTTCFLNYYQTIFL